jgi:thymidine kinase
MYSGKSTRLKQLVRRYLAARMKCLTIKYQKDERYDKDYIATHDLEVLNLANSSFGENIVTLTLSDIPDEHIKKMDVIAIDEGQFFSDIYSLVWKWVVDFQKTVIVASLDSWHNLAPCMEVLKLIPLAREVVKLNAICTTCYRDCASCTHRLLDLESDENVGGHELYEAACLSCYMKRHDVEP